MLQTEGDTLYMNDDLARVLTENEKQVICVTVYVEQYPINWETEYTKYHKTLINL